MSQSSRSTEPITVDREGISVTKRLLLDAFSVPTIEFEVITSRDEPIEFTLREYVPDGYSLETIGFHSEYESDNWDAYQDNRIEFTRTIEPGETVQTLYGLRLDDTDEVDRFMGEPELVSVTSPGAENHPAGTQGGAGVHTQEAADHGGASPGQDAGAATVNLEDAPPGAVAAALAEEFRDNEVEVEDREAIQEALDLDLSKSAEAQFRQLQTRVEDLIGYTDIIEEFIDAGGPKEQFEDLDEHLNEVEASIDELREDTPDQEDLATLDERLADLEETIAEIDEWRDQLGDMLVKKEE